MTREEQIAAVRDAIAKILWSYLVGSGHRFEDSFDFKHKKGGYYNLADRILDLPDIAVVDENQDLTTSLKRWTPQEDSELLSRMGADGWKKILKIKHRLAALEKLIDAEEKNAGT